MEIKTFVFWFHPSRDSNGIPRRYDETVPNAISAVKGVKITYIDRNLISVFVEDESTIPLLEKISQLQEGWDFRPSRRVEVSPC
jgi:hypothetical protein